MDLFYLEIKGGGIFINEQRKYMYLIPINMVSRKYILNV